MSLSLEGLETGPLLRENHGFFRPKMAKIEFLTPLVGSLVPVLNSVLRLRAHKEKRRLPLEYLNYDRLP